MTFKHGLHQAGSNDVDHLDVGRREFFRNGGAAGLVGAALGAGLIVPMGSAMAQTGLDFPKPKGLLRGGQSDSRLTASFAAPVTEGLRLVIEYFNALNHSDVAGIAKTLNFQFAIYEHIEPLVYKN